MSLCLLRMTKPGRLFDQESKSVSFTAGDISDDTEKPFSPLQRCSFCSVTTDNTFRAVRYSYSISQFLHNSLLHYQNCTYDSKVAASTPVHCLTLCLNPATCFTAFWVWTGAAHCSPHISASLWLLEETTSFVARKTVGRPGTLSLSCSLNYLRIFTGRCRHEEFNFFTYFPKLLPTS